MAFSDLQLKAASKYAIMGAKKYTAPFELFAHNFKELDSIKGSAIAVPVYSFGSTELTANEFSADSNNWCSGDEINGATLTLDKHLKTGYVLTDVQAGYTDVNLMADGARAIGEKLGFLASRYVFETMHAGYTQTINGPNEYDLDGGNMNVVAKLYGEASNLKFDPYNTILVINSKYFGQVIASLNYHVYGSNEPIKNGVVPGAFGFYGVIADPYITDTMTFGYLVKRDGLGIATRVNKPVINGYAAVWTATDKNGLTFGFRAFEDLCSGSMKIGGDLLIGAKAFDKSVAKITITQAG